jgi:periplasmic protein TonB
MNATIVSSFPALHSFRSPRSVAMACIVLLHVAFFFALSSGLGIQLIKIPAPDFTVVNTTPEQPVTRSVHEIPVPGTESADIKNRLPYMPPIDTGEHTQVVPPGDSIIGGTTGGGGAQEILREPIIQAPEEDQKHPLSAPLYPAQEIRADHAGTVVVRVQILENGSVGDVELVQSSGFPRLDESAMREAKRWRMKPGMRDGVPVSMWKEVPITFRLKDRGATDL